MTEDKDRLIEGLRATRPAQRPTAEEWVSSDRGRRVLDTVLASAEAPAAAPRAARPARPARGRTSGSRGRGRSWGGYQTVLAAATIALVVVGVSLGVGLGHRAEPTTVPPVATNVTKVGAVMDVVQLVHTAGSWSLEHVGSSTTDSASLLADAVEQGLVTSSEITGASGAEPILEGEFAVLLWKAFSHYLPAATAPTSPVSAEVDPQVAAAIQWLQGLAVIQPSDGVFDPARPLTAERERLLLSRMESALKGQPSK